MTSQEFCYWLQGFLEIGNPEQLTAQQTQILKDHLGLVFGKVTPERNAGPTQKPGPGVVDYERLAREADRLLREGRKCQKTEKPSLRERVTKSLTKPIKLRDDSHPQYLDTRTYC